MLVKGTGDLHGNQKRELEKANLQDTGNNPHTLPPNKPLGKYKYSVNFLVEEREGCELHEVS